MQNNPSDAGRQDPFEARLRRAFGLTNNQRRTSISEDLRSDPFQPSQPEDDRPVEPSFNRGGIAGPGGQSEYDRVPDQELLETPEHLWMGAISPQRVAQIARRYPEHGVDEAAQKISKILNYGDASAGGATAVEGLKQLAKHWRLSASAIAKKAEEYGLLEDMEQRDEFLRFMERIAPEYGISPD